MTLSDLTTICVLMAMSMIALVCLWLIGATTWVWLFTDRVVNPDLKEMAKAALSIIGSLGTGLVMAVLVQKVVAAVSNQPKQ